MDADITGLMAQPTPGWEQRVKEYCNPTEFRVEIELSSWLSEALTEEERHRLYQKLALVREYARVMATGMLKGTLKYPTDNYTVEQWMAHLIGEGADQSNYALLLAHKWKMEHEKH